MKASIARDLAAGLACILSLVLYGCGGGATVPVTPSVDPAATLTEATQSDIRITNTTAGVTPFIASVQLSGQKTSNVASVTYTIAAKPQTVSAALKVTWTIAALTNHGYVKSPAINLPVAGLYANYVNSVSYVLTFSDNSTQTLKNSIPTTAYIDTTGVYLNPTIIKARTAGSKLGFNFFFLKSTMASPVIVDTDAEVRWMVPGVAPQEAQYFEDGQFIVGSANNSSVYLIQLDGKVTKLPVKLPQPLLASFTHNIDPGPNGALAEFNGTDDLGASLDDIVAEMSPFTAEAPDQTYDVADIVSSYMTKHGDNASAFVHPGVNWFHVNSAVYDPSDKSVIISGREDFLMKVDYETHNIIWIFGDPTKYWYTFPSLKAKALTLVGGGIYPVGQHGVTFTSDGHLMIFNNGYWSDAQPAGKPQGVNRTYSAATAYSINASAMTAKVAWNFDYGQKILSQICGSSYEAGKSYLVDFATADHWHEARLVGLDSSQNVVFDFEYQSPKNCGAAWNAIPVPFENLQITK